jgi:MerR family transcriptional regulator, mercuric resistance operon regulatory protein
MTAPQNLTIGAFAKAAGVNVETVRYYQRRGLLCEPPKPRQGYRTYTPETVERLRFIKRAQELGFTLSEIKNLLSLGDGHCSEARDLAEHKLSMIRGRIHDLKAMEHVLMELVHACREHGDIQSGCPLIETLGSSTRT